MSNSDIKFIYPFVNFVTHIKAITKKSLPLKYRGKKEHIKMKKILFAVIIVIILAIVILNLFPEIEAELHRITGWY